MYEYAKLIFSNRKKVLPIRRSQQIIPTTITASTTSAQQQHPNLTVLIATTATITPTAWWTIATAAKNLY